MPSTVSLHQGKVRCGIVAFAVCHVVTLVIVILSLPFDPYLA